jgi:hypothetical protein
MRKFCLVLFFLWALGQSAGWGATAISGSVDASTDPSTSWSDFSWTFFNQSDVDLTMTFSDFPNSATTTNVQFRMTRPRRGAYFLEITNGALVTNASDVVWTVNALNPTNFPPAKIYFAEFLALLSDGTTETLAQGKVDVQWSLFSGTNSVNFTPASVSYTATSPIAIGTVSSVKDADGDTKIDVEESADEDIIRFDTAGTERMTIAAASVGMVGVATAATVNATTVNATSANIAGTITGSVINATTPTFAGTSVFGDGAGTLAGKMEIGGTADQPQLVIEGHSTQTDDIFIIQDNGDTEVFSVSVLGDVVAGKWNNKAMSTFGFLDEAETILLDWVNIAYPWADNEIVSTITRDTEWDSESEMEAAWGSANILIATEIDSGSKLRGLIGAAEVTGTGKVVSDIDPTFSAGMTLGGNIIMADTKYIGLDFNAGRIKYDNEGTDILSLLDANVRIGNGAPGTATGSGDLYVESDLEVDGNITAGEAQVLGRIYTQVGLDAVGSVDMDYGSADVNDHTFTTDGTGDGEIVLPEDSISDSEIDEGASFTWTAGQDFSGATSMILDQEASPAPTAEGTILWETDDDHIVVGDGSAGAVEFVPAEDVSGDITMTDDGVTALAAGSVGTAEIGDIVFVDYEYFPATAFTANTTDGAVVSVRETSNKIMVPVLEFDASSSYAALWHTFPEGWDEGTVKFKFHWTCTTVSGNVKWGVSVSSYDEGNDLDIAMPSTVFVVDDTTTDNYLHKTDVTAVVTVEGSPANGDAIYIRVQRAGTVDSYDGVAELIGCVMEYSRTNLTTAAW